MRIVVDTNIIFSALLLKNSKIRDILFNNKFSFYAPNFFFSEIFKYKEKIFHCTHLSEEDVYEYLNRILENIEFVRETFISMENREAAYDLCREIDERDTPFIALALELDAYVWTGDRKLSRGLKERGFENLADIDFLYS